MNRVTWHLRGRRIPMVGWAVRCGIHRMAMDRGKKLMTTTDRGKVNCGSCLRLMKQEERMAGRSLDKALKKPPHPDGWEHE